MARPIVARPTESNPDRASLPLAVVGSLAIDLYSIGLDPPGKM